VPCATRHYRFTEKRSRGKGLLPTLGASRYICFTKSSIVCTPKFPAPCLYVGNSTDCGCCCLVSSGWVVTVGLATLPIRFLYPTAKGGNKMNNKYWFDCTVAVSCPYCGKESVEKIVCASPSENPDLIAQRMLQEKFSCQLCKKPFPNGVQLRINVMPSAVHDPDSSPN
jgi:hypothetical protein